MIRTSKWSVGMVAALTTVIAVGAIACGGVEEVSSSEESIATETIALHVEGMT